MRWCRFLLIAGVLAAPLDIARAGIFFNRKPKTNPGDPVISLIYALKTDPDENKRKSAAEELRNSDANAHPEVLPALIESALHDSKVGVRIEALQSLGKLRPISQQAGQALEQSAANDPSIRVQLQARSTLLQYRLSGYRGSKSDPAPMPTRIIRTDEPPLAVPLEPAPIPSSRAPIIHPPVIGAPHGGVSGTIRAKPLTPAEPQEQVFPPLMPIVPPPLQKPPITLQEEGPELIVPR